jgi:predicted acylesterase/phospholipase RssA
MKKSTFFFLFPIFLFVFVFKTYSQENTGKEYVKKSKGTAILITGAAARIPQEAALLENLYYKGMLNDVVFISGASSGALNTVMLNGILGKKITWKEYKKILFSITNDSIFKMNGKKLPVDTSPLKNFLTNVLHNKLGYYKIGDLPIPSSISISDIDLLKFVRRNYRLSNLKINPESDPSLDLVEVLMASTAFPIAFPKAKINNATTLPEHDFVDGGLVDDHIPFKGLLDFIDYRKQSVEKVIVISRKADSPELSEELLAVGINDKGLMDKLGISLDEYLMAAFIRGLKSMKKEAPELAEKTKVYVPDFEQKFLLLDFNNLKQQFDLTSKWAENNLPISLNLFLESEKKH